MKKILILFLLVLLCGCSKEKYFLCKTSLTNEMDEYKFNAVYKIYYKDTFVTKIEKEEIYTSNNEDTLEYLNEYKKLDYSNLNKLYGGITYNVEQKETSVNVNATLDMSIVDVNKMVKDKYIDSDYAITGKISTSGIKYIYEEKGAKCDI